MKNLILMAVEKLSYGVLMFLLCLIFWMNAIKVSNAAWNISLVTLLVVIGMASAWIRDKRVAEM